MTDVLNIDPKFICIFFGHKLKHLHGQHKKIKFNLQRVYDLFAFLQQEKMDFVIAYKMLKQMFLHPRMDFESILAGLNFKKLDPKEVASRIPFLSEKFNPKRKDTDTQDKVNALMGQLRNLSEGNMNLTELAKKISLQ
jgi:glutamyl-tRNA(Gln) amidotransferase subunit E